jgi:hypothetical protein
MGVMNRTFRIISVLSAIGFASLVAGCQTGGVGDPCTPEDEYQSDFSGFSVNEVNVESRSFQCETRVCLVNHFQGRVSCPYGNKESSINVAKGLTPPDCVIPSSGNDRITVAVDPQIAKRKAADAVYCSCRCNGPESDARYCECPSGFSCVKLVDKLPIGHGGQLAGSYCIRENTTYINADVSATCRYPEDTEVCGKINTTTGEPL